MKKAIRDRYRKIKAAIPRETMLMVRVGDFYEALGNDAAQLSAIAGVPRPCGRGADQSTGPWPRRNWAEWRG